MDIIGRVYKDYFIDKASLNGNSYFLKKFSLGGIFNVINQHNYINKYLDMKSIKYKVITNNRMRENMNIKKLNLDIQEIYINENCPQALIFEDNLKRTSFVTDDNFINLPEIERESEAACVFYGDKLFSKSFLEYKQLYLDTAANSYEDIYSLSTNSKFHKNTFLSVSQESLTEDLLANLIRNESFIVLAHSPENTKIFIKNKEIFIKNKYFLDSNTIAKEISITGLGDIFTVVFSFLNYYRQLSIEESVISSQKFISDYLKQFN